MQERVLLSGMLQPFLSSDQMVGRNVLLATDFSNCSARALGYALGIASRYESQPSTQSELISEVADDTSTDLIVLAVPETHRFTNRFLSTDSYRVVSGAACPVLTVGAR
jgi:hypothetical protein